MAVSSSIGSTWMRKFIDGTDGPFDASFAFETTAFTVASAIHSQIAAAAQAVLAPLTDMRGTLPPAAIHFDGVTTLFADDSTSSDSAFQLVMAEPVGPIVINVGGAANTDFNITINYTGDPAYASYFQAAAARWSQIITTDIPDIMFQGNLVDDLVIDAQVSFIDGAGSDGRNILGQAGPDYVRLPSYLPIHGVMTFDSYDLAAMASQGILDEVILHEMGHVLGIGTVWTYVGLRTGDASYYGFTGANALAEYKAMSGNFSATSVPVQPGNVGGSSGAHWSESVFQNELMTPSVGPGTVMPISRLTIASLKDLGYTVNMNAADPYTFPGATGPGLVSISDVSISEGNSGTQLATFTVSRSGGAAAFSVNYATSDGSALAGPDYVAKSGTLTFGAGINSQTFTVGIVGDTAPEADENFFVNLYGATNGAAIADSQGTGTILNDDVGAGSISIANASIIEGNSGTQVAVFTVTRTGGSQAFSVNYATGNDTALAGSDYVGKSGTLNFAAGVNSQTIAITINGDVAVEKTESFLVYLSGATNNALIVNGQAVGIIVDDDSGPGSVSIDDIVITEGSSGTHIATFTVTRENGVAPFSVNYATADGSAAAGSDYVATSGTLNFGTDVYSKTISVIINGDMDLEDNESFFMNLSGATAGATISDGRGQGIIVNDDVSSPLPDDYADSLTDLTAPLGQASTNGSASGNLETAGDIDWFRLALTSGEAVTIKVQGLASAAGTLSDPYLYVYNPLGQLILQNDDSGIGNDAEISFSPSITDIYYVAVGAHGDGYAGTYRINVVTGPDVFDDRPDSLTDDSRSFGQAVAGATSYGELETVGDRDWFAIQLTAGTTYTFDLLGSSYGPPLTLADPLLRLHDGSGELISQNDDFAGGFDSRLTFRANASGTYYLEAGASNDGFTGLYYITVGANPNHGPTVTAQQRTLIASAVHQALPFSALFNAADPDNDSLLYYLSDDNAASNSGHWVVAGVDVPALTSYQVTEDQLAQTYFVAGARGLSDNISLRVYDGFAYSNSVSIPVTVPAQLNNAPTVSPVSGANVTASAPGQSFQFSSLFAGNDADQDPLTYYLYDATTSANSGYWKVGGVTVAAGTIYAVSAAQLAQATFVAGAAGTADSLYVQSYDGIAYSGWNTTVRVSVPDPVNHAPVVIAPQASVTTTPGQSIQLPILFVPSDSDGDALSYYVYDSNSAANSGYFLLNGFNIPAQTIYALTATQFGQTTFVAGAAGVTDNILVQAFDGKAYSGWNTSVNVNAAPPLNHAPTVNRPLGVSVSATAEQSINVASLFAGNDSDGDQLSYFLYDSNTTFNSGHFVVDGVTVPAQTIYALTAAQFAQAIFVAGAPGVADDILVQAFDGKAYSGWTAAVNVAVPINNQAPIVSLTAGANVTKTPGQSVAISTLFSASDADGDVLSYFLYDANAGASSGHLEINGVTVTAQTITAVSAAQLAQTTFIAGADGTSDGIYLQASDGKAYSGWNAGVTIKSVAPNNAPTVSLLSGSSVNASAGQTLQLSDLFAGSDADSDPLSYFIYDTNDAAGSGHVEIAGQTVAAKTITAMSAAQLAQAVFIAGGAGAADDIFVQAFDGKAYSGWNSGVHIAV